jgi:two-component system, cell cycle sensor histidine kinase and response regulator CckA
MRALNRASILIVEDDEGVAELERQRLENAGHSATVATTAAEALQLIGRTPFDLLLLDYRLPGGVDGLDLFNQVKARGVNVPAILVTGCGDEATVIKALRLGVYDFVAKSTEFLEYLPEAVSRVLQRVFTEDQLAESQAQLASIIATAKDAILVTDEFNRITLFNAAAEKMFGCPAARALGTALVHFMPPEMASTQASDRSDHDPGSLSHQIRSGTRGVRADGSEFPLEASLSVHEVRGKRLRTIMVRDVTERERAAEAFRKNAERFRLLVEGTTDCALITLDSHGGVVSWNSGAERIMGQRADEAVGEHFSCFYPDDVIATGAPEQHLKTALAKGRCEDEGWRLRHDGTAFWANVVIATLRNAVGEFEGFSMITRDLTERKRADEAYERLRDLVEILERANDAIMLDDLDDRIVFWNRGAERLYGWSAAEVMGLDAGKLLFKEAASAFQDARSNVLAKGDWLGELGQVTKNGRNVIVSSHWTLLRDESGQPRSKLVINTDITDKKKLEMRLQHAQRLEAIGVLAGGVAHDFNNLLTVINGYSELLLTGPQLDAAARDLVRQIHRAGGRAEALTRQLLAFSRKQVLAPQVLDLNELIGEMEKMLRRLIGDDINLAASLEPGLGRVKADPGQLEQVVMNLVVNARDAMPRGGFLTLATRNVVLTRSYAETCLNVQPGPFVLLSVTDTGVGMDEATKARIFEPFFTTKEPGKGTGLGLSTVHGIIQQSGGHLEVYSEMGQGTTFKIYLPRLMDASSIQKASMSTLHVPSGAETILLVEDDPGIRKLAGIALQSYGYTVLEAAEGAEGMNIGLRRALPIDLLITDVVMPKMSGREMVEQLRPAHPEMKVLYISGYTDDAIIRHGILEDGVFFLHKPFTPTTLARKVREVLDSKR